MEPEIGMDGDLPFKKATYPRIFRVLFVHRIRLGGGVRAQQLSRVDRVWTWPGV